ncbi:MAG: response regulator [Fluviicola sp.]|jgi:DNA-binding response OmpR family regulator|nr:response regulator [Fluviicola sp.]
MSSKKILIVDDEPNIVLSLDYLVRKKGYEPFIARNGGEAISIAKEQFPDLVILDIMMPDIDGYEVCKLLKNDTQLMHAKIIFLSAKSRQEDVQKGLDMGADAYLTKPFSTKRLMQVIGELLSE